MVFRLISEKTIEEKQYQRQIYKQQLDNVGLQNRDQKRFFFIFSLLLIKSDSNEGILRVCRG